MSWTTLIRTKLPLIGLIVVALAICCSLLWRSPKQPAKTAVQSTATPYFGMENVAGVLQLAGVDASEGYAIARDGAVEVNIKNTSTQSITLTHIGAGMMSAILALPTPDVLKPGQAHKATFMVQRLGDSSMGLELSFGILRGGASVVVNSRVEVLPPNRVAISNAWMMWQEKSSDEKTAEVLFAPKGVEITSVAAPKGFSARLSGKKILVKPTDSSAERGVVELKGKDGVVGIIHVEFGRMPPLTTMAPPASQIMNLSGGVSVNAPRVAAP